MNHPVYMYYLFAIEQSGREKVFATPLAGEAGVVAILLG